MRPFTSNHKLNTVADSATGSVTANRDWWSQSQARKDLRERRQLRPWQESSQERTQRQTVEAEMAADSHRYDDDDSRQLNAAIAASLVGPHNQPPTTDQSLIATAAMMTATLPSSTATLPSLPSSQRVITNDCKVCFQSYDDLLLLLPCRHYGFCKNCVANVKVCPLCQQAIKQAMTIFI